MYLLPPRGSLGASVPRSRVVASDLGVLEFRSARCSCCVSLKSSVLNRHNNWCLWELVFGNSVRKETILLVQSLQQKAMRSFLPLLVSKMNPTVIDFRYVIFCSVLFQKRHSPWLISFDNPISSYFVNLIYCHLLWFANYKTKNR